MVMVTRFPKKVGQAKTPGASQYVPTWWRLVGAQTGWAVSREMGDTDGQRALYEKSSDYLEWVYRGIVQGSIIVYRGCC